MQRFCVSAAAANALMAIIFGAFGAHALKDSVASLPAEQASRILGWVDTGAKYQLAHAAALLALAALAPALAEKPLRWAAYGLAWGPALFGATLYGLALGGPLWLGAVTPVGGLMMVGGWAALGAGGLGLGRKPL